MTQGTTGIGNERGGGEIHAHQKAALGDVIVTGVTLHLLLEISISTRSLHDDLNELVEAEVTVGKEKREEGDQGVSPRPSRLLLPFFLPLILAEPYSQNNRLNHE